MSEAEGRVSWRETLRTQLKSGAESNPYEDSLPEDPAELESALRIAMRDQISRFDPKYMFQEQLVLRIVEKPNNLGRTEPGVLPEWSNLLRELPASLFSLGFTRCAVKLVAVSQGSSVLHFAPEVRANAENLMEAEDVFAAQGDFSSASNSLLSAVARAEQGDQPPNIVAQGLQRICSLLQDTVDLLEFSSLNLQGRVRKERLSKVGFQYLHGLSATTEHSEKLVVNGTIVMLKQPGTAKVKTNTANRTSFAPEIELSAVEMDRLRLSLGQHVSWQVIHRYYLDKIGCKSEESYEYVMPWDESEQMLHLTID